MIPLRVVPLFFLAAGAYAQDLSGIPAAERAQLSAAAKNVKHLIGHRGSMNDRPENTLVGYQRAMEVGATAIECDVCTTRDGVLISMHDADVRRTTNGQGLIRDLTFAELRKLDAGKGFPKYAGAQIPTLREILELAKGKCDVVLDLKETGDDYARRVVAEVREFGEPRRMLVGVRSVEQAKQIRTLLPEALQIGLVPNPAAIDAFAAAKVDVIRLWLPWLKDATLVPKIRKHGVGLHLNGTTCTLEELRVLLGQGPTVICSDDPGQLARLLDLLRK